MENFQKYINKIFPTIVKEYGDQILSVNKGKAQYVADKFLKIEIEKKKEK